MTDQLCADDLQDSWTGSTTHYTVVMLLLAHSACLLPQ